MFDDDHEWMRDPEQRGEGLVCRWCGVTEGEAESLGGFDRCASAGIVEATDG